MSLTLKQLMAAQRLLNSVEMPLPPLTAEEREALSQMPPELPLSEAAVDELYRLDQIKRKGCHASPHEL